MLNADSKKFTAARILKGLTCLSARRQLVKYASGKSKSNSQPGNKLAIGSCMAACHSTKLTPRSCRAGFSACQQNKGLPEGAAITATIKRGSANTAIVSDMPRISNFISLAETAADDNASSKMRVWQCEWGIWSMLYNQGTIAKRVSFAAIERCKANAVASIICTGKAPDGIW